MCFYADGHDLTVSIVGGFCDYDCATRYYTQNRSKVVRLCYKMVDSFNLKLQTLTVLLQQSYSKRFACILWVYYKKKVYIYGKYQLKMYLFSFE